MELIVPKLQHPVAVTGDPTVERWPTYLNIDERTRIIGALLATHGLVIQPIISVTTVRNPSWQLLVGDHSRSRKIMIDERDPMGVIYLITDDGTERFDFRAEVDRAITLGMLVKNVGLLELDQFKNNRLEPRLRSQGSLAVANS